MALETLSSNEILNFLMYDNVFASKFDYNDPSVPTMLPDTSLKPPQFGGASVISSMMQRCPPVEPESVGKRRNPAMLGRKKRRRRQNVCKNKEESETQRMTHIAVERNRRKLMNEHLAVLRSLMPESYLQRGDQASIVGGAIEYVKELEHLLQSLEAQKLLLLKGGTPPHDNATAPSTAEFFSPPFSQFIMFPQYTLSQVPNKNSSKSKTEVADIEVTLIETHANLRILSRKSLRQVSKIVAGFRTLYLTILHLNVTTLDPLVLYTISAKVEERCQLKSANDIAGAVHHMLGIIEGNLPSGDQPFKLPQIPL
ncbi:hypothetical protein RHSIM_Rhsim11G0016700 [Rhododendron simsii]|uniref:BHLH domain-containing protein n=1 Tax=Rhododendron simsii TaxID=118357 RepID=A0A834G7P1_RHOSS|nr:hypothetical protein RHSIM_Rhsim11G0016700 [Rhododendron simsii]